LVKGVIFLDPDFGWRVQTGRLILRGQFPRIDPFSYTMPSFPFVDHAWLVSALFAFIYDSFGMLGVSFVVSLVNVSTLLLAARVFKSPEKSKVFRPFSRVELGAFASVGFLLLFSINYSFFGVRAQVFSWFFFVLLLFLIFEEKNWLKRRKFFPLLIFVWANVHGSFVLGLALVLIYIILNLFSKKRFGFGDFLIFFLGFGLSFVNPYKNGLWRESLSSFFDVRLRFFISEWMPLLTMIHVGYVVLIVLCIFFIFKGIGKYKLNQIVIFSILLFLAIGSKRNVLFWALFSLPLLERSSISFYKFLLKIKYGRERFVKVYKSFWLLVLTLIFSQMFLDFISAYQLKKWYPSEGVSFLKSLDLKGEIFSDYGWGGYLIWKLPEKKVFIDGRMPSWKNSKVSGERELYSAFDTYLEILSGKVDFEEVAKRFAINYVLFPKSKSVPSYYFGDLARKVENFLLRLNLIRPEFDLASYLEKKGWIKIFETENEVIYEGGGKFL